MEDAILARAGEGREESLRPLTDPRMSLYRYHPFFLRRPKYPELMKVYRSIGPIPVQLVPESIGCTLRWLGLSRHRQLHVALTNARSINISRRAPKPLHEAEPRQARHPMKAGGVQQKPATLTPRQSPPEGFKFLQVPHPLEAQST